MAPPTPLIPEPTPDPKIMGILDAHLIDVADSDHEQQGDAAAWDWSPKMRYATGSEDAPLEFLTTALSKATIYVRSVGYFHSAFFGLTITPIANFVRGGGQILLVTSVHLDDTMLDALDSQDEAGRVRYLAKELGDNLDRLVALDHDAGRKGKLTIRRQFLALLLSQRRLRLKVAVPVVVEAGVTRHRAGIHHEKLGLIGRRDGSAVSFIGSINETMAAWERGNFESIDVFSTKSDPARVRAHAKSLTSTWSNDGRAVRSYDVTTETAAILRQYIEKDLTRYGFLTLIEKLQAGLPGAKIELGGIGLGL